jgi:hypothetical protein
LRRGPFGTCDPNRPLGYLKRLPPILNYLIIYQTTLFRMAKSLLLSIIIPVLACLVRQIATLAIQSRQATINAVDPFDHTWIEQWAALGDSFSVGLGAGHEIKSSDNVCATTCIYIPKPTDCGETRSS